MGRETVPLLVEKLVLELSKITEKFEIILVDDYSPDNSWEIIQTEAEKDIRVKGIRLSRNFGQHKAITAGLSSANGEYTIVMDCDLQDDPVYIHDLMAEAKKGFDIVYTIKERRKHGFFKNLQARIFNYVFNFLADSKSMHADSQIGAYSLITKKVVKEFLKFGDQRRHYLMVLRWLGFSNTYIRIQHLERKHGKSSYTLAKLINHAIDGITAHSDKVLILTVYSGFFLSMLSMIFAIAIVAMYFHHGFQAGWTSLFVVILFFSGVIITTVGIVGVYVGRTFEQSKGRQLFIIDKKLNL